MKEIATQIKARFLELGVKIELNEIETKLDQLINTFRVPPEEARRNVTNYFVNSPAPESAGSSCRFH